MCHILSVRKVTLAAPGVERSVWPAVPWEVNQPANEHDHLTSLQVANRSPPPHPSHSGGNLTSVVKESFPACGSELKAYWWLGMANVCFCHLQFYVSYQQETCQLGRENKIKSELSELHNCILSCLEAWPSYLALPLRSSSLRNILSRTIIGKQMHIYICIYT